MKQAHNPEQQLQPHSYKTELGAELYTTVSTHSPTWTVTWQTPPIDLKCVSVLAPFDSRSVDISSLET